MSIGYVNHTYIKARLELLNISYTDMAKDLQIKATDLGYLLSGAKPLSKVLKALFYYYLKSKGQDMCREFNVKPEQLEQMLAYNQTKHTHAARAN